MAKKGRPVESAIRQRIIEILYFLKEGYGYDIYKIYRDIFPHVTMRSIYYHLNKVKKTMCLFTKCRLWSPEELLAATRACSSLMPRLRS